MNKFDECKERLIELRKEGLGNKRLAKELGVSNSTIVLWLRKVGMDGTLEQYKEVTETYHKNHLIVCSVCGEETASRYRDTKFCSDKCRGKHFKQTQREKECERCGEMYVGSYKSKYCSDECRAKPEELRKKIEPKPIVSKCCVHCSGTFHTTISTKKFCCSDCSYQYRLKQLDEQRKAEVIHYHKRCKECGKHYTTTRSTRKYCTDICNERYRNRQKETTRRKRIMMNGKVDWNISIERLLKRDGHTCYLCGEVVNTTVDTNDDCYPSIEHIIPISKGGTHTWGNVKIAHRYCNSIKSDKIVENETNYTPPVSRS